MKTELTAEQPQTLLQMIVIQYERIHVQNFYDMLLIDEHKPHQLNIHAPFYDINQR